MKNNRLNDYKKMDEAALLEELKALKSELFKLRLSHAMNGLDNPNKIDEEKIKGIDRKYQEIEDSVFLALKALNELEEIYNKLSPNEITNELTTEHNRCIARFNTMLHNLWARLNNIATRTTYCPKNFEGVNVDEAYFDRPHLETLLQKAISHYHGWAENSVKTR